MASNPVAGLAGRRIGIDASVLICWLEDDAEHAPLVAPVFAMADRGELGLVASALVLAEVLVAPYQLGRRRLAERYASALCDSPSIELIDVGRDVLRTAAELRAGTSASAPNAIHLATAQLCRCSLFLTTDRRMPEVPGLPVMRLAELGPAMDAIEAAGP